MSAHQAVFPIATMARVLGVSKAGYYAWLRRSPSARAVADEVLMKRIRAIHVTSQGTYGVPRVHAELRAGGERHGRKRIARLMRSAGIVGVSRRRARVVTTQRDKDARSAPDLVDRDTCHPPVRESSVWLGASGRSPTKRLWIVKRRARVHGRRLSLQLR